MSAELNDALAAADPRRSAWVSANAGAGKTHTLANRVTRLLLDGAKPERILCLTYTKSAAAEMQARLFTQLGAWAMFDDAKLGSAIAEIGATLPDANGLKHARRLFALALETPGGLKIQTIHSFCERLLGRFPIEAGIPPAFRVLDEQSARDLIAEARAQVLERAGAGDSELAAAVAHIVTETSESRLHTILDAALGNDRRKLERFFSVLPDGDDALRQLAERAHGVNQGDTVESIAEGFCAEAKAEAEQLAAVVAWLSDGSKTDRAFARELQAFSTRGFSTDAFRSLRDAFCKAADGEPREKLVTKGLAVARPELAAYVTQLAERFIAAEQRCRAARAALLAHAALTLADAVRDVYTAAKRARGVLDYNDLISETLALLNKSQAAAWVLYKLDGGLDHVLIDEAQDTSPEQWQIVRKLTEEFFAGEGKRDLFAAPRTVFAVGDQKQSIFSFQGADPDEFEVNRRHFAAQAQDDFADVRLRTSRRSAPEILRFVDEVFADPAAREGLASSNEDIKHEAFRKDAKGLVEFWPAIKPVKTPEPDYWRPVDVESETSPVVQLAEKIAGKVRKWLDDKVRLPGRDEPIRAGDIMILMPRREPFATEIIRKLTQMRVPVAGADRIRLKNEIAVMDLMALGGFALLPEDDLNLAALLRSPLVGFSEEELFALANGRQGRLWRELTERREELPSFDSAHAFLSEVLRRADYAPPYEFFARVLSADNMRARLLARLGSEASDAIDEFLSLALEYESLATPSLEGFLHWVERGDAEVKRDMERGHDQVRVMTVHGAKGLEADIVFLPDTTTLPDPPGRRGELLYQDDRVIFPIRKVDACEAVTKAKDIAKHEALKEHRRLLYVALTRAKDRLYVCGFENKTGIREESWYRMAEAAMQKIGKKIERADNTIWALGEDTEERAAAVQSTRAERDLPEWVRAIPPAERERPRLIRPSDELVGDEPATFSPAGPKQAKRFRRGLLIHTLLARLPEIARAERRAIALAFLAAQGEEPEEAGAHVDSTLRVLDDPQFAAAFAPGSKAEIAIVADLPELGEGARVSGRIDRLAVTPEEVLAIDFKTNRPPPARVQDVAPVYVRQMALYRLALAKLFPDRRIGCALVWTEGPRLMPLPPEILDKEAARLRSA
ncbi:MAG TPA: double-strand break repair helicase AddA [Rhizomicrobium sp.]|nr:double-strand break repair helicase AddA [Rhizomicrobium sp.]